MLWTLLTVITSAFQRANSMTFWASHHWAESHCSYWATRLTNPEPYPSKLWLIRCKSFEISPFSSSLLVFASILNSRFHHAVFICGFCRGLKSITDREVCCFMISCKNSTNIDSVIDWLVKHSKSKSWRWVWSTSNCTLHSWEMGWLLCSGFFPVMSQCILNYYFVNSES